MKPYLASFWNTSIFSGEIISSMFFVLLFLVVANSKYIKNKTTKTMLIAFSTAVSIFIGKGISNIMEPGSSISFGFSLNLLITSIFFNQFQLVLSLLGAEIIGSILALVIYKGYKIVNDIKPAIVNEQKLNIKKHSINTLIQQVLLVISLFAISFFDYNNGMTPTNTDAIIKNMLLVGVLIVLVIVFANNSFIMISPIIALALIIENHSYKNKDVMIRYLISSTIHISVAIGISFGLYELKEISWR